MSAASFPIVIPTWNNLPYLRLCISSIRRNSTHPHEVLVHVNEGHDGTLEYLRSEGIRFTHSPQNVGICTAVNSAVRLSDHPLMCCLNDDMYCLPEWDAILSKRISQLAEPSFMISGTMIEPVPSNNPCAAVADYGRSAQEFQEQRLVSNYRTLAIPDWYGSSFCPFIMPRDLWDRVGGLGEDFSPGMSSDPDLAMKCWRDGCRVFLGVGDSLVYHFQCKSTGRVVRNPGPRQFLRKWGITQTMFNHLYLRKGKRASMARLAEPRISPYFCYSWARSKMKLAAEVFRLAASCF